VFFFGDQAVGSSGGGGVHFLDPGFAPAGTSPTTELTIVAPFAGTLRNLRVLHNTAGNAVASITYTVRVNGVDTALTPAGGAVAGNDTAIKSDVVNTVAVAAGDKISMKGVVANAASGNVNVVASMELI
jgi:hypothetical protein